MSMSISSPVSLSTLLKARIGAAVETLFAQPPDPNVIVVEPAARPEFGDVTTNVAMRLARPLGRPPRDIAEALSQQLAQDPWIRRADAAGPGYVNLDIAWDVWMQAEGRELLPIFPPQGGKVIVEHTSINPNKAAHVGHLRNACIGDSVARLLRRTGQLVEVHNYIDDLGRQVADTVTGLLYLDPGTVATGQPRFCDFCWDVYAALHQGYQSNPSLKAQGDQTLHELEAGDNRIAWMAEAFVQQILEDQQRDMARFGIRYDLLVHESDILRAGLWETAFSRLQGSSRFVRETDGPQAGCWVLRAREDDEDAAEERDGAHMPDKVLVRSNGLLTYTAKDIAYHLWKFGLLPLDFRYHLRGDGLYSTGREILEHPALGGANTVINVIDRRQSYPQEMVQEALQAVGFEDAARNLHHIGYAVVSLSRRTAAHLGVPVEEGRDVYPMAGRQGIGIKIADLLALVAEAVESARSRKEGIGSEAIASGAIRYYLLRHNLQTDIVLDTDSVADIHGNTGPYVMYTHARAAGILRRADPTEAEAVAAPAPAILDPWERMVAISLAWWPDVLVEAARAYNPTVIATYVHELAERFNRFYEECPILRAGDTERRFRLALVRRVVAVMADGLDLLGVPAPDAM